MSEEGPCPCSDGETQTSQLLPPPQPQATSSRTSLPRPTGGIPRPTGGSRARGIPRPAGAIPRAASSRVPPPSATSSSKVSTASGSVPKLIKSSVTTTSHDDSGRSVQKTVTTKRAVQGSSAQRAVPARLPTTGSRLQVPRTRTGQTSAQPGPSSAPTGAPSFLDTSQLVGEVQQDLMEKSMTLGAPSSARGGKKSPLPCCPVPTIMTEEGPVPIDAQMVLEQRVDRGEEGELVLELMTGIKPKEKTHLELTSQHFDPSAGLPVTEPPTREVITIKSSVSIAGDVAQSVKTIVYEKTGPVELELDEVAKMVEEENETINDGIKMSLARPQTPLKCPKKREQPEDAPEDLQPEMLAAIMHTEEQGLAMAAPPTRLYNFLFPEGGETNSIPVSSVVPAPLQDVVVPTSVPREFHVGVDSEQLQQAQATAAEKVQLSPRKPTDGMYAEATQGQVPKSTPPPVAAKVKRRKNVKPVSEETPPWEDEDYQPIANLVGATPSPAAASGFDYSLTEPEKMFPTDTSGLEYILVPQPPSHVSRVQLRGTTKPSWFPGFYITLPDRGPGINLARSPSAVLMSAWREVQPATFIEDSFVVG